MTVFLNYLLTYATVFGVGGLVCSAAQILVVKTKLTPARILVIFLILGIVLEGFGIYKYIFGFAKSGISIPIIGFGASLARGSIEMARQVGFLGAFAGGLVRTAYGVGAAIVASYIVTLVFSPKSK